MQNYNNYYRPMQYLGAKTRALGKIVAECDRLYSPNSYVLDLFSGSSIVSQACYNEHKNVISNDVMGFCCDIASAMLNYGRENGVENEVLRFVANIKYELLSYEKLTSCFKSYVERENSYLSQSNLLALKELYDEIPQVWNSLTGNGGQIDYIYHHLGKTVSANAMLITNYYAGSYFGIKQALDMDYILNKIHSAQLKNSWVRNVLLTALYNTCSYAVNSAGKHFAQPIQISDDNIHKITNVRLIENRKYDIFNIFEECVRKILKSASQSQSRSPYANVVLNMDICSSDFLEEIKKYDISVIYADPPYTAQQYSRFYHIPEVLHNYVYPVLQIFRGKITKGLYPEKKYKSPFCSKRQAWHSFIRIFELSKTLGANLVLSYSESKTEETGNERMVTLDDILRMSSSILSDYKIRQVDFDFEYKQLNNKDKVVRNKEDKEILLVYEKEQ